MTTDRTALINIGGEDYTLVLTTKATKEIHLKKHSALN